MLSKYPRIPNQKSRSSLLILIVKIQMNISMDARSAKRRPMYLRVLSLLVFFLVGV
jgi:hypothetical protein